MIEDNESNRRIRWVIPEESEWEGMKKNTKWEWRRDEIAHENE